MFRRIALLLVVLGTSSVSDIRSQGDPGWTPDRLSAVATGFQSEDPVEHLRQIADLLKVAEASRPAVLSSVRGEHREYVLEIRRQLDRLRDERWLVREDAERNLRESGARAFDLIRDRAEHGETLEERIRARRVLEVVAAEGEEFARRSIRLHRGLLALCAYLEPAADLTEALLSASGGADRESIASGMRALGMVGGDGAAEGIGRLLNGDVGVSFDLRRVALSSLGSLGTAKAARIARSWLQRAAVPDDDALSRADAFEILRSFAGQQAIAELLEGLDGVSDPVIAEGIRVAASLPPLPVAPGQQVELSFVGGDSVTGSLIGLLGDRVAVASAVDGLEIAHVAIADIDNLVFSNAEERKPLATRVFLTQGSLVGGDLIGLSDGVLTLDNPVFGRVEIPQDKVQGIALDQQLDRLVGASRTGDRLRLADGSLVDGRLVSIEGAGATLAVEGEAEPRLVPLRETSGVLFERREPDLGAEHYTRVETLDGQRLVGYLVRLDGRAATILVPDVGSAEISLDLVRSIRFDVGGGALWGFTVIADYSTNRVVEIGDNDQQVFAIDDVFGPWDVECLANGNLLVTEFANRVVEFDRDRNVVWEYTNLKSPMDADRLANGNTLVCDTFGKRVIEIAPSGEIVWSFAPDDPRIKPFDVERLADGNTLIADGFRERLIEVSPQGEIVWELTDVAGVHDVDMLPSGRLLVTQRMLKRVIEIDRNGTILFEIKDLKAPSDADRLPDGNTLVAESGRVREFDRKGNPVWELEVAWAVEVNRY